MKSKFLLFCKLISIIWIYLGFSFLGHSIIKFLGKNHDYVWYNPIYFLVVLGHIIVFLIFILGIIPMIKCLFFNNKKTPWLDKFIQFILK